MKSKQSVSIVIPVYNEQDHLSACLGAIARQSVRPLEVIVVDNNSTDKSRVIAGKYNFVKVISERRQGVVYARNRGFDAAKGDIIARIDADSIVPEDWVETIANIFDGSETDAISGAVTYYDMALARALDFIDAALRRHVAKALGEDVFLYGANMALRRRAWESVRGKVCLKGGIHEDFDLAIHLEELGWNVAYDERLTAAISTRRADSSFIDFCRYTNVSPHTYAEHNIGGRVHMYPVVVVAIVGYLPLKILRRGYDPLTDSFSLGRALSFNSPARVDPTVL